MKDPQTKMSVAARHTPSFQFSRDPIPITYALLNVRGSLNYLVKNMCSRTVAEDGGWALQQFFKGRTPVADITLENETRLPVLARGTLALVNVRAICTVVVTTFATGELVDVLRVVRAMLPGISDHHLPVSIPETDCGCPNRLSSHAKPRYETIFAKN